VHHHLGLLRHGERLRLDELTALGEPPMCRSRSLVLDVASAKIRELAPL
jgi:hypothetical protein